MNAISVARTLIWIQFLCLLAYMFFSSWQSEEIEAIDSMLSEPAIARFINSIPVLDWIVTFFAFASFVLWFYALYQLYRFRSWGRTLYVVAVVADLLFIPVVGSAVVTTSESLLIAVIWMSTGAILAVIYLSPVRRHFEASDPVQDE